MGFGRRTALVFITLYAGVVLSAPIAWTDPSFLQLMVRVAGFLWLPCTVLVRSDSATHCGSDVAGIEAFMHRAGAVAILVAPYSGPFLLKVLG